MYICICKGVTDKAIRDAVMDGADFKDIRQEFGISTQCGKCSREAKGLVKQTQEDMRLLEKGSFYAL